MRLLLATFVYCVLVVGHLIGKHNQKSHGRKGRKLLQAKRERTRSASSLTLDKGRKAVGGGRGRRTSGGIDPYGDDVIYDDSGIVLVPDPPRGKPSDRDMANIMRAYPDAVTLLWGDKELELRTPEPEEPLTLPKDVKDRPIAADVFVESGGEVGKAANDALAAIDSVHRDGVKRTVPLKTMNKKDIAGEIETNAPSALNNWDDSPVAIRISKYAEQPRLTAVHELGHYLDHEALGERAGRYASDMVSSEDAKDVGRLRMALNGTPTVKRLEAMRDRPQDFKMQVPHPTEERMVTVQPDRSYLDYMLEPRELFVRAYAQYIADRSSDPTLKQELAERQAQDVGEQTYPQQWTDEEFGRVGDTFDRLFESLEWST